MIAKTKSRITKFTLVFRPWTYLWTYKSAPANNVQKNGPGVIIFFDLQKKIPADSKIFRFFYIFQIENRSFSRLLIEHLQNGRS